SLEGLGLSAAGLWRQFGVAARERGGRAVLDLGNDLKQIALVALAVLLGRPLRPEDFPVRRATIDLALSAWRSSLALAPWFVRALEPNAGFTSPGEGWAGADGWGAGGEAPAS